MISLDEFVRSLDGWTVAVIPMVGWMVVVTFSRWRQAGAERRESDLDLRELRRFRQSEIRIVQLPDDQPMMEDPWVQPITAAIRVDRLGRGWTSTGRRIWSMHDGTPVFISLGLDGLELPGTRRRLEGVRTWWEIDSNGNEILVADADDVTWPNTTITANEFRLFDLDLNHIATRRFGVTSSTDASFTVGFAPEGIMRLNLGPDHFGPDHLWPEGTT